MPENEVYELFQKHFSSYIGQVETWSVKDENSIKVYFKDGRKYIYTVINLGFRFEKVKGD